MAEIVEESFQKPEPTVREQLIALLTEGLEIELDTTSGGMYRDYLVVRVKLFGEQITSSEISTCALR